MEVVEAKPHNPNQLQAGECVVMRGDKHYVTYGGDTRRWEAFTSYPATDKGRADAKDEAERAARAYPKYEYAVMNVLGTVKVKPVEPEPTPVVWTVSL